MEKTWITQFGRRIKLSKMDDRHLLRTIHLLETMAMDRQRNEVKSYWLDKPSLEQIMADPGVDDCYFLTADYFPVYDVLLNEAAKRNLLWKKENSQKQTCG